MIVSFRVYAGQNERFASDAFESAIGRDVKFHVGDAAHPTVEGVLTGAAVANDGSYVLVTVETPDDPDGH